MRVQCFSMLKRYIHPDSEVHGANTGPTWVLSSPDEPHVGPMNLAIRDTCEKQEPGYPTYSLHWLAMLIQRKHLSSTPWIFRFHHHRGYEFYTENELKPQTRLSNSYFIHKIIVWVITVLENLRFHKHGLVRFVEYFLHFRSYLLDILIYDASCHYFIR